MSTSVVLPITYWEQLGEEKAGTKTWDFCPDTSGSKVSFYKGTSCLGLHGRRVLQEGGPLLRSKSELFSNTWIDQGDTQTDKARDFIGKGHPGGEQGGKGNRENCSAASLVVSGLMVMKLVSGLSLANFSDSGSSLVTCASLSQDGFQLEEFWKAGKTCGLASPLSFWPFPNSFGWW